MSPSREPAAGATVSLTELGKDNYGPFLRLKVTKAQESFVANNWISVAQAHFAGDEAWYRGISAGGVPVGFVQCEREAGGPEWYLWRYMIDARYQGRGYGHRAMELVIEHARSVPGVAFVTLSFVESEGSPEPFYAKLGFRRTGEIEDGEQVMRFDL
jgi:diamine N-acetyltransferase